MSCHDIGRGLNNVVREVVTLMDNNEISKDAARKIIKCCKKSVHWCDGNETEAINYIRQCVCGKCLNKLPKGEKIYPLYRTSHTSNEVYNIMEGFELVNSYLCKDCFDFVENMYFDDNNMGEKERKYIEEKDDVCISTGEYEDENNGYPW